MPVLAEQVDLMTLAGQSLREARVVDVGSRPAQQIAVEDQDAHGSTVLRWLVVVIVPPVQNPEQTYRLRAPASGREALAKVKPDGVYVDRETGEEMQVATAQLPLAPSESALARAPENLRTCRRCNQLIGLDVSDCPYCGLRQPALNGS
jgi:hypothetical protein